jgi:DNA-directed RNA polymerase specialized sigma24 family protein
MYTDQERLERAEIIGAKLIEIRQQVLLTLRIKYGLQDDVAEDIYSDTCCYMLSRGVELLQNLDCGGAIRRIAKNRALNHIRDHKRYSRYAAEDWDSWGKLADDHDPDGWIYDYDNELIISSYIKQSIKESERAFARGLSSAESVPELSKSIGINQNTAYGIFRRLKTYARQYEQG